MRADLIFGEPNYFCFFKMYHEDHCLNFSLKSGFKHEIQVRCIVKQSFHREPTWISAIGKGQAPAAFAEARTEEYLAARSGLQQAPEKLQTKRWLSKLMRTGK